MTEVEKIKEYFNSWLDDPIKFINDTWGLSECKSGEKFIKGKHTTWQQYEILKAVKGGLTDGGRKIAVRSGRGIGKSTVMSWLMIWFLLTRPEAQVSCTAPTSYQMHDVLWKEVKIWIDKLPSYLKSMLEWSNDYIRHTQKPYTWFARARTAKKEQPEALSGVHGEYVMMVIDEASAVADECFEAAKGTMTNKNTFMIMISNPTRLVGYFYRVFKLDKGWKLLNFSSEDSPLVDKSFCEEKANEYGSDSDIYRVDVLGEFPHEEGVDTKGYTPLFSPTDLTETELEGEFVNPRMGVDPSGEGSDKTAWVIRDKFRAKIVGMEQISTPKQIAQKTLTLMEMYGVKGEDIYVDNFGSGANVSQELALVGVRVNAVNVGEPPDDQERYLNKRAEAFWRIKQWLRGGGELQKDLRWKELNNIRYRASTGKGKFQIMGKMEMKKAGYRSPNFADGLMLSFFRPDFFESEFRASYDKQEDDEFDKFSAI